MDSTELTELLAMESKLEKRRNLKTEEEIAWRERLGWKGIGNETRGARGRGKEA